MKCPYPMKIVLKGGPNKGQKQTIPCGKCGACLQARRNDWAIRLKEEQRVSLNSWFITLTYDESNLPISDTGFPTLVKHDLQLFLKKLRRSIDRMSISDFNYEMATDYSSHRERTDDNKGVRYYAIGEYGTKYQRPHYHIILFNTPTKTIQSIYSIWTKGHVHIGEVGIRSIMYCLSYHITRNPKLADALEKAPEFATMSRRPELGIPISDVSPNGIGIIWRCLLLMMDIACAFQGIGRKRSLRIRNAILSLRNLLNRPRNNRIN